MKSQPIPKRKETQRPTIIDLQAPPKGVAMRTVIFVEMAGMSPEQFAMLAAKFSQEYQSSARGDYFFCPVRDGQIQCDPYYESEFLDIVHKTCEIKDDQIVLKDGITPVHITREFVGS